MSVHLLDEHGRPVCPEARYRDSLSDGEFWDHVFNRGLAVEPEQPDESEIEEYELETRLATPCPECGQSGACEYDAEGRPLIHVVENDENEEGTAA